jgi:hypothetical protein
MSAPENGYHDNVQAVKGRLPHDSQFQARYDATATRWVGTLSVRRSDPSGDGWQVFEASAGGVFKLLVELDELNREWRRTNPPSNTTA